MSRNKEGGEAEGTTGRDAGERPRCGGIAGAGAEGPGGLRAGQGVLGALCVTAGGGSGQRGMG